MVAVVPFAGLAAAINALAAPIVVGITTAIDSSRSDRAWWPAVVGAAASVSLFAAELGIGAAGVSYSANSSYVSPLLIAAAVVAVVVVAAPLAAPLALAGALAARLLSPGPADDEYDLMSGIGSLVAAAGLLAAIGFGGGLAVFEIGAGTYEADWGQKQQAAGWGVAMLAGLGVSLVALTGGSIAAGVGLIGQLPGGGEE